MRAKRAGRRGRTDSAEPHAHSTRPTSLFRDKNLFIFVCKRIRSPITFVNKIIGSGLLLKVVYMHKLLSLSPIFHTFCQLLPPRRPAPARPPPAHTLSLVVTNQTCTCTQRPTTSLRPPSLPTWSRHLLWTNVLPSSVDLGGSVGELLPLRTGSARTPAPPETTSPSDVFRQL